MNLFTFTFTLLIGRLAVVIDVFIIHFLSYEVKDVGWFQKSIGQDEVMGFFKK